MAAQRRGNGFVVLVSAAVVIVLIALAGVVVWLNSRGSGSDASPVPTTSPASALIDPPDGALVYGAGPTTVDVYMDFLCPICASFEDAFGAELQQAAADDEITLRLHPVGILDRYSQGAEYSTRAANAMYCVAESDPDAALDFFTLLFENQPAENTTGLTDEQLVALAQHVGADAAACVTAQTHAGFVASLTATIPADPDTGRVGTPTVAIDGEKIPNAEIPAALAKILG